MWRRRSAKSRSALLSFRQPPHCRAGRDNGFTQLQRTSLKSRGGTARREACGKVRSAAPSGSACRSRGHASQRGLPRSADKTRDIESRSCQPADYAGFGRWLRTKDGREDDMAAGLLAHALCRSSRKGGESWTGEWAVFAVRKRRLVQRSLSSVVLSHCGPEAMRTKQAVTRWHACTQVPCRPTPSPLSGRAKLWREQRLLLLPSTPFHRLAPCPG